MANDGSDAPRVAPGPIKGSGNRTPWIVLVLLVIAALAIAVSILLALLILRS